jgi:glycosyltransferase involved in cell wall biosynthesis
VNHQVEKKRRKIIHIARLDIGCKQQDILINMFSKLAQKYTNWDMELWGVGSDHDFLKEQIQALDLEQRIFLKGFTQDPLQKLKEADLFAFPSKYEGFPLALTEAMSLGLPCVGFSSCSGVNELIKDKQTGYLASSIAEFETCLSLLMDDGMRRAQFGLEAHRSMEQYASDMITSLWDKCINEIVEKFNVQH